FLFGGFQTVKWLAWFSVVGSAVLMVEAIVTRTGRRGLALFGSAALLSWPLLMQLAESVYMDHFIMLLVFSGTWTMIEGIRRNSKSTLCFSAFLMGCAGQIKYNVAIFCIIWSVALIVGSLLRQGFLRGLQRTILPITIMGITAIPWYLYTYSLTG